MGNNNGRCDPLKRYFKWWMKEITYRNNPKPTEKLVGPHNERGLPSKNYNQWKNGRQNDKRQTKNGII